jgi:hypothetical protein
MRRQQEANSAAAPTTQNVFEATQKILDQRGIDISARQFAQQHGIDTTRMLSSSSKESVTEQVRGLLGEGGPPKSPPPTSQLGSHIGGAENAPSATPAESLSAPAQPLQTVGGAGPNSLQPAGPQPQTVRTPTTFGTGIEGGHPPKLELPGYAAFQAPESRVACRE